MAVTNEVRMPNNKAETETDYLITTTVLQVIISLKLRCKGDENKVDVKVINKCVIFIK